MCIFVYGKGRSRLFTKREECAKIVNMVNLNFFGGLCYVKEYIILEKRVEIQDNFCLEQI